MGTPRGNRLMDALLELQDVTKAYALGKTLFNAGHTLQALRGVDLAVRKGETLGLVGESGCGKTTLARLILGIEDATSGSIRLDGAPVTSLDRLERAARVQPVFQDPYSSLNPHMRVARIIAAPLEVRGIGSTASRRERVRAIMHAVGLAEHFAHAYPNQLSGGQRQRVAIARALIGEPEILLCDEPTSALDVSVQSQILNMLQELRRDLGLTYLLISHNLAVVDHMATRVAVMYLGRIVEEAETDALFRAPKHPYTQALLASVLTPEPGLGVPDTHLGAAYPNPLDMPAGCRFHPRCAQAMERCRSEPPRPIPEGSGFVECHLYSHPEPARSLTSAD
jgi:peptide/nickel transport system ATP-binding protein